eukprot:scaffold1809_cov386-Prasinococcus_capsulatus_cf.AAC.28
MSGLTRGPARLPGPQVLGDVAERRTVSSSQRGSQVVGVWGCSQAPCGCARKLPTTEGREPPAKAASGKVPEICHHWGYGSRRWQVEVCSAPAGRRAQGGE